MNTILAIETATEACSVALLYQGSLTEIYGVMPRQHSQKVLSMIDQLLANTGVTKTTIDAIAFGCGPGAFTGVRIATAITQGLAFALDKPVIPVSTLSVLAQQAIDKYQAKDILATIDARMDEVYWARFKQGENSKTATAVSPEQVTRPECVSFIPDSKELTGIGTGCQFYERFLVNCHNIYPEALPHAKEVAKLAEPLFSEGKAVSAEQTVPVYLRNSVANKKNI